ncbi:MAG: pentapeptide repeat-containing protein, partial [Pseudomonadota bacterium]
SWAWDEDPEPPDVFYPPRADIQTALTVLGRRSEARLTYEKGKDYRLDLRSTAIPNADLTHARLGPAQFHGANLQRAVLEGANLQEAGLGGANLLRAVLRGANLQGARLRGANFESADLVLCSMALNSLRSVVLRGARNLSADSITSTFGVKRGVGQTVLPNGITPPDHWHDAGEGEKDTAEAQRAYQRAYEAWLKTQEVASKEGGDPA